MLSSQGDYSYFSVKIFFIHVVQISISNDRDHLRMNLVKLSTQYSSIYHQEQFVYSKK